MISLVQPTRWSDANALDITGGTEKSDDCLIAEMATGDHRAFSQLVARHAERLRAVALRFTGNDADAEEILQDTFWKAWRKAKTWQAGGEAKFSTWLYRTLVNQCIDQDRKRRVRSWFSLSSAKIDPEKISDGLPDPEAITSARKTLELVQADITKLPARQRVALLLSVVDERSNREIADTLGVSIGAVEQALVRARRKLREEMRFRAQTGLGVEAEK